MYVDRVQTDKLGINTSQPTVRIVVSDQNIMYISETQQIPIKYKQDIINVCSEFYAVYKLRKYSKQTSCVEDINITKAQQIISIEKNNIQLLFESENVAQFSYVIVSGVCDCDKTRKLQEVTSRTIEIYKPLSQTDMLY
jgi:hypothetical protein